MQVFFSLSSNESLFSGIVPLYSCSWSSQLLGFNNQGQQETSISFQTQWRNQQKTHVWESSFILRLPGEEDLIKL